ncbi:PREDICTED: aminopeptidase 2, mitochondrial-like [Priapulus caudatus]|uniref:Aminopeptidase 2, mitochondrial-like n=1 Tax=Priapulus caudatus TaxID=37621 RepID=A0ABM1DXU9_PRICU|nr:PREDICTED: aminopeptidase 2, mitochondrial-like [Priapulus caudatus]
MTQYMMGQETYTRALTRYLNRHAYGTYARTDDLWTALTEQADEEGITDTLLDGRDMKTIMDTWTLQNGYPLITVTRDYAAGTVLATQQRFLLDEVVRSARMDELE